MTDKIKVGAGIDKEGAWACWCFISLGFCAIETPEGWLVGCPQHNPPTMHMDL